MAYPFASVLSMALLVLCCCCTVSAFVCGGSPQLRCVHRASSVDIEATKEQILSSIKAKVENGKADPKFASILKDFLVEYADSVKESGASAEVFTFTINNLLRLVGEAFETPYQFDSYHKAIREPFDYYTWGNKFLKPLVIMDQSTLLNPQNLQKIKEQLEAGENVVLLSNHQTEADPQVMSILFEEFGYPELGEKVICVAGHKVTTDPMAIPFSMGRNLLCIHSKKHMGGDDKAQKQMQNMQTMRVMQGLMKEGGAFIWVAPSGGRDRPGSEGEFVVSKFDDKSVEMFRLMAVKAGKLTHFYPFAMFTHRLVPPPDKVLKELGEQRSAKRGAVSISVADEIFSAPFFKDVDASEAREAFALHAQTIVEAEYDKLKAFHS